MGATALAAFPRTRWRSAVGEGSGGAGLCVALRATVSLLGEEKGVGVSNSDLSSGVEAQFVGRISPTAARIQAGGHPCQGIYWTPKGQRPHTALIATHYNVD